MMNWFNKLNKTGKGGVIVIFVVYFALLMLGVFIKPILEIMIALTVILFTVWAVSFVIDLTDGKFNE